MVRSFYDGVTILYISIIFMLFQQNKIAQCQDDSDDNDSNDGIFFDYSPEELFNRLDNVFEGVTHLQLSFPPQCISDNGWLNSDEYFVRFNPIIRSALHGKLLVGSLSKLNQISVVSLCFYDMNDNMIQDNNGQPLQYTLIPQDLGHFLEFSPEELDYSYARFLFKLLSNVNFDPNTIFFHFSYPLSSSIIRSRHTSKTISTSTITFTSTSAWSDFSSATTNDPNESTQESEPSTVDNY